MIGRSPTSRASRPLPAIVWLGAGGAVAFAVWLALAPGAALHAPRVDLLRAARPVVQWHMAAALSALAIGTVLLLARKGRLPHRTFGWTWVVLMTVVVTSSAFIHEVHPGHYSWIHLFSGWVAVILPVGVLAARRHDVRRHSRVMSGIFVGGLLVAGAFTLVPGRMLWNVFFGQLGRVADIEFGFVEKRLPTLHRALGRDSPGA